MSDTDVQLGIVKSVVDSGPIVFPRAIAYHPDGIWTIIVYRKQLMEKYSDEQNQTIARWLMETTRILNDDYKIKARWARE